MCGIAGFTRFHEPTGDLNSLRKMGDAIAHRGPDSHGEYLDDYVGLAHRRLSIIDLSEAGNQPMFSSDGDLVMVFNGEIYNFVELRKDLEQRGYQFRTRTDSEVILGLYAYEGEACLEKLNGMFAIAIWSKSRRELFLARDRLGKKPLYYYHDQNRFFFASEIKAILSDSSVPREVRDDAVRDFFAYQYVPDNKAIFRNFYKVPSGHWMKVSKDGIQSKQYWDVRFDAFETASEDALSQELLELLEDSTRLRMVSDVPLGAFLSGGVDSSGIVGLMAKNSDVPVTTCSIGFDSRKFDEIEYAAEVARRFNTDHHELTVKENVIDRVEEIVRFFDEPFADQSLVPTYFVSNMARKKVTVALAGDGGDENFAGYEKYRTDQIEHRLRSLVPGFVSQAMDRCLSGLLKRSQLRTLNRAGTLITAMNRDAAEGFYRSNAFISDELWGQLANARFEKRLDGYQPSSLSRDCYQAADTDDHLSSVLYTDIKTYLSGDILVKVDRMSMANSLEVRAPILDYRVVEFAARIPSRLKIHRGDKKHILKQAFSGMLPDDILYRQKMGFSTPLAEWLRQDLRSACEARLFHAESGIANFIDITSLRRVWQAHQDERRDYSAAIWSMWMFELWWQAYMT